MATPFKVKLQRAQSSCISFSSIASEPLVGLCTPLTDAIGCPVKFIFFPLLTIVAACMAINAQVKVNPLWSTKAKKDSCTLRLMKKPLLDIEQKEAEIWRANRESVKQSDTPPQLIDNFSFEELHHVKKRNGSQILGLFDGKSTLYG